MNEGMKPPAPSRSDFGRLPDGTPVERFVLDDGTVRVAVLTYGGILQQVLAPDREGQRADVVLGFDDLAGYLTGQPCHGATIGRFANRIARGVFPLNGTTYQLDLNFGEHHIHGGAGAYRERVWEAEALAGELGVRLRLTSPDGDCGYPGALDVTVGYRLADGVLQVDYTATSTEPAGGLDTVVNLTNHTYFNLAGHDAGPVGDHRVEVPAGRYVVAGPGLIPTGEFAPVDGTPLDLRVPRRFAEGWDAPHDQIVTAGGYDHSWVLDGAAGSPVPAARVVEPTSGRVLEVATDQPASHVYSGNMMEPLFAGKGGHVYGRREGFCVETQHFADSPNRPEFPSTVLAPGETFRTTTSFRFTTG
ncbi:MAG: aldose 1-epimerase [Actinomycetota bacterium]|nr:aldose 1-epimerase [Actinomycetota bacterium]